MEHEIYISGIGGQGIQLVAKVLAMAAMSERRRVMLNGFYGYEMRGGLSLSTVVIGDAPLKALPVSAQVGSAIALHNLFWEKPMARLRKGALVVTDDQVSAQLPPMPEQVIISVGATAIAREIGNPMVAGMALMSAYNSITGLVLTDSLIDAMKELVPAYRRQHVEANQRALAMGAAAVAPLSFPLTLASAPPALDAAA